MKNNVLNLIQKINVYLYNFLFKWYKYITLFIKFKLFYYIF